jgi:hypothetical protein
MIETPADGPSSEAAPTTLGEAPDPAIEAIDGPPLPPPPDLDAPAREASRVAQVAFRVLNPRSTVPIIRSGLGAWMGTPIGGWLLVIRVRGRKSGLGHDIPLSYLVEDGCAWVMAGFGPQTQWYRNLLVDPHVELVLPGRPPMRAIAEEVRNREIRARIVPHLVRATGVPGYMAGADPFRAQPERILEVTSWVPLIRLRPEGEPLLVGPDDPGGHGWIWRQVVVLTLSALVASQLVHVLRRVLSPFRRPGR